jgi:DNA repair protein RecO
MNQRELTGYVISRKRLHDSDLILTIYGLETGKISVIARGIKHPRAKLQSHAEPLIKTKFRIIGSGKLPVLVAACGLEKNLYYTSSPEQNIAALLVTEIIDKITVEGMPNSNLFLAYSQALKLMHSDKKIWLHLSFSVLQILKASGVEPQITSSSQNKYYFNLSEGTVRPVAEGHESLLVTADVVKLWKVCLHYDIGTVNRINADDKVTRSSLDLLVGYIQYYTHKKLKSVKVLFQSL